MVDGLFLTSVPGSDAELPQASLFQDQSKLLSASPRPVFCNLSAHTSSFHICRAWYLQFSQALAFRGLRGYMCPSLQQLRQMQIDQGAGKCCCPPPIGSEQSTEYDVCLQVSSFMRYESCHSLSPCDWYYTLTGFNNGFKAQVQLRFNVHHIKPMCCYIWCFQGR